MEKRHKDLKKLQMIVERLSNRIPLEARYKDHALARILQTFRDVFHLRCSFLNDEMALFLVRIRINKLSEKPIVKNNKWDL